MWPQLLAMEDPALDTRILMYTGKLGFYKVASVIDCLGQGYSSILFLKEFRQNCEVITGLKMTQRGVREHLN